MGRHPQGATCQLLKGSAEGEAALGTCPPDKSGRWALAAASTIAVALIAAILTTTRGAIWFYDDWDFVFTRRQSTLGSWLAPHNSQLTLLNALIYKAEFAAFGVSGYVTLQLIAVLLHVATAGLVMVYAKRFVATAPAAAIGLFMLLFGNGWQVFVLPFSMNYSGSLVALLVCLLAIERGGLLGDVVVGLGVAAALVSSSVGIPVVLTVAAELVRQRQWARLLFLVPSVVGYIGWQLAYGEATQLASLQQVASYLPRELAGAFGGLLGLDLRAGALLAGFFVLLLVDLWVRRQLPSRVVPLLLGLLAFWVLTAFGRAAFGDPTASRYLYVAALFLSLMAAPIIAQVIPRQPAAQSLRFRLMVSLVATFAFTINLDILVKATTGFAATEQAVRAELTAVEILGPRLAPDFRPDEQRMPQVAAGEYFPAVTALGSPALTPTDLSQQPEPVRALADGVLARGLGFEPAGKAQVAECPGKLVTSVSLSGGRILLVAESRELPVDLRRFSTRDQRVGVVPAGETRILRVPTVAAPGSWEVSAGGAQAVQRCRS